MNNRSELQTEYFELIRALNKTNLKKDQKTEIKFLIKTDNSNRRYLAATTNNEKYLRIGNIDNHFILKIDNGFEFQDFGEYLKKSISHVENEKNLYLAIRFAINRLFAV